MVVNYRDLTVYKKARELVMGIDQLVKAFPPTPQARVISNQMFDAVTSIGANIAEGKAKASDFPADSESGFKPASSDFIDGIAFDGTKPNDYLGKFTIGLKGKQKVAGGKISE